MSKLAALAAKRRQKENEKQQNSNANLETSVEDSASSLSKPRIEPKHKTSHPNGTPSRLRKNIVSGSSNKTNQEPSFSEQDPPATMEKEPRQGKDDDDERDHCALEADIGDLRAKPSSFARVLVDFPDTASSFPPKSSAPLKDSFITPFDFTKPSPDDVVLKAQNFKGLR